MEVEIRERGRKRRRKSSALRSHFFCLPQPSIECRSSDFAPSCLQRCSKHSALRAFAPWESVGLFIGCQREREINGAGFKRRENDDGMKEASICCAIRLVALSRPRVFSSQRQRKNKKKRKTRLSRLRQRPGENRQGPGPGRRGPRPLSRAHGAPLVRGPGLGLSKKQEREEREREREREEKGGEREGKRERKGGRPPPKKYNPLLQPLPPIPHRRPSSRARSTPSSSPPPRPPREPARASPSPREASSPSPAPPSATTSPRCESTRSGSWPRRPSWKGWSTCRRRKREERGRGRRRRGSRARRVRRSEERSGGGFFRKSRTPLPPQRVRRRVLFPLLSLAAAPFRPLPNRLFVSLRAVFS